MVFVTLLSIFVILIESIQTASVPSDNYANIKVLVEPDVYMLYWNYSKTEFIGEVHAKTQGWIGFGLSPNGGMDGSDVFIAWIQSNGKTNFTDRHIKGRSVLIDTQQDWMLLDSLKKDDYLIIKFKRRINTCDNKEDLIIEEGTPRVIYAWDTQIPSSGNDISYHGSKNRGSLVVQLISSLNNRPIITSADNLTSYEFRTNVTIPNRLDTYYHCHMFKLPKDIIEQKHHLLRIETLITSGNEKNYHHWLLYQCDSRFENEYLMNNSVPYPGNCFDDQYTYSPNKLNTWSSINSYCFTIALAWAIGGSLTQEFPDGLGLPFGGQDSEFNYFYLQIHYDNPDMIENLHDESGIRLYFTQNLRKIEIGTFTLGTDSSWPGIIIPPNITDFIIDSTCRLDCLNKWYNGSNITVFASNPHTHLIGKKVYTTIIRNGKEIGYLQKTFNYDFDYQYTNFFNNPVVLRPGDELKTTCIYDSAKRTNYTFGGIATTDEMCLEFLYYYPKRRKTGACVTGRHFSSWISFFSSLNASGSIQLGSDLSFHGIQSSLNTLKFGPEETRLLIDFYKKANISQICDANSFSRDIHLPMEVEPLIEDSECVVHSYSAFKSYNFMLLIYCFMIFTF